MTPSTSMKRAGARSVVKSLHERFSTNVPWAWPWWSWSKWIWLFGTFCLIASQVPDGGDCIELSSIQRTDLDFWSQRRQIPHNGTWCNSHFKLLPSLESKLKFASRIGTSKVCRTDRFFTDSVFLSFFPTFIFPLCWPTVQLAMDKTRNPNLQPNSSWIMINGSVHSLLC